MRNRKKKISQTSLNIKKSARQYISNNKQRYIDLTKRQFELRKKGVDIEIVGMPTDALDDRTYIGALHYFDINEKYTWKRVPSSTYKDYNDTLEDCIKEIDSMLEKGEILLIKRDLF